MLGAGSGAKAAPIHILGVAHQLVCFESLWMIFGQYSSSDCNLSSDDCLRSGDLDRTRAVSCPDVSVVVVTTQNFF